MERQNLKTEKKTNTRWKIFYLLLALVTLNYIDRAALSVAMPSIAKEFGLTPEVEGLIFSAFFWTYLFMQIPSGMLADKYKPRAVIALATIFWGFFQGLAAFSFGWVTLLLTRLGLGISESPIYPAGGKLNALWMPPGERTRGAALLDGGSALGSGLGAIVTVFLMTWFNSWRAAFAVAGIGTMLCGLLAWWYIRNSPRDHKGANEAEKTYVEDALAAEEVGFIPTTSKLPVAQFFKFRSTWGMCLSHTCTNLIFYGLMTWLPSYLLKAHGFNLKAMGNATFLIFLCGFVGEICCGWIADNWRSSGAGANLVYRSMLSIGAASVAVSMAIVAFSSNPILIVALLCVALFFVRWCGGCNWATPAMLAQRGRAGALGGIMNFGGNIAGIFVPFLIGIIVQKTGSYFFALLFFVAVALVQIFAAQIINYQKKLPV